MITLLHICHCPLSIVFHMQDILPFSKIPQVAFRDHCNILIDYIIIQFLVNATVRRQQWYTSALMYQGELVVLGPQHTIGSVSHLVTVSRSVQSDATCQCESVEIALLTSNAFFSPYSRHDIINITQFTVLRSLCTLLLNEVELRKRLVLLFVCLFVCCLTTHQHYLGCYCPVQFK